MMEEVFIWCHPALFRESQAVPCACCDRHHSLVLDAPNYLQE